MKRIFICAGLAAALVIPSAISAQDNPPPQPDQSYAQNPPRDPHALNHGEIGVYGDLLRVTPVNAAAVNFLGIGGRVGFNMGEHAALEAEMNYDFQKNWTTVSVSGTSGGGTSTTVISNLRPLTALFGPKFGTAGPVRAFVTGKVGFIEMSYSNNAPSGTSFGNSFNQFGGGSTHFAAYPGGGLEFFLGPVGIRAEAGDEMYFNNGTYNNLRVTFGPTIRF